MDNQLLTLSKIFTERLFRIPDYQRGYAWTNKQLKDFWNDLDQLSLGSNHYTGVLTLENVSSQIYEKWEDDLWIIKDKNYQPYFVVDGQQRLTTTIILIQAILEKIQDSIDLNHTESKDIRKKFIFDSKDKGISRSYIFGYEKDNPSYEFLKTKIFLETSSTNTGEETIYTQNLENAKRFFQDKISKLSNDETEKLYKKITQQLLFNIFTITDDVDVCVAFETMNNRGKPLSYLELLKNRLIYLSLKIDSDETEKLKLRRAINDCWKTIYHNLGRNKENPLDDDWFLRNHYLMYFGHEFLNENSEKNSYYHRVILSMRFGTNHVDYSTDLLERRFITKKINAHGNEGTIDIEYIYKYVSSLQDSVDIWYKIFNPKDSKFPSKIQIFLEKINRLNFQPIYPLVLTVLYKEKSEEVQFNFLKALERFLFVAILVSWSRALIFDILGDLNLWKLILDFQNEKIDCDKIIKHINNLVDGNLKNSNLITHIIQQFSERGFYDWEGIRYFLYEYELSLKDKSKTEREKISWESFREDLTIGENNSDYITIEHIYPQRTGKHEYWKTNFPTYTKSTKKRKNLVNSLGNLLPLSKPKNSSLSNLPFPIKKSGRNGEAGYFNGGYAENEVALVQDWNEEQIKIRGLKLLNFMEKRWNIDFMNDENRIVMLGLSHMLNK